MEGLHWVSFRFRVQGLRLPLASDETSGCKYCRWSSHGWYRVFRRLHYFSSLGLVQGHFTYEPRAVTMKLWGPTRKCPKAVLTHFQNPCRLYIHLAFTCSVGHSKGSVKWTWTGSDFSTNERARSIMVTGSLPCVWSGHHMCTWTKRLFKVIG
jgi:hypothetical protein